MTTPTTNPERRGLAVGTHALTGLTGALTCETANGVPELVKRLQDDNYRVWGLAVLDGWARDAASCTFAELVLDPGGVPSYRPTLDVTDRRLGKQNAKLADAYDDVQRALGSARRAYRG